MVEKVKSTVHGKYKIMTPKFDNKLYDFYYHLSGGIKRGIRNLFNTIFRPIKPCMYCQRGAEYLLDTTNDYLVTTSKDEPIRKYDFSSYYIPDTKNIATIIYNDSGKMMGIINTYAKYCPMCGRKIQEWETEIPLYKKEIYAAKNALNNIK
jgi:hypothetical protein